MYKCKICEDLFDWLKNLVRHETLHKNKKYDKCRDCSSEVFLLEGQLEIHSRNHHD